MKNLSFLLLLLLSAAATHAQGREDLTAEVGPGVNASHAKNLVFLIGSDQPSRTNESSEKALAPGNIKYAGLQYLYLPNRTLFSAPVTEKLPLEIISQTSNKIVFKIPKIRYNILEVDLHSVLESTSQLGVQVATISFK